LIGVFIRKLRGKKVKNYFARRVILVIMVLLKCRSARRFFVDCPDGAIKNKMDGGLK